MKKIFIIILIGLIFLGVIPKTYAEEDLLKQGKAGILIEANSGEILFEKNKDERVAVASMTKMVGLIIIMEHLENGSLTLDEIVTASKNASGMGGSQIYLDTGEKMSVKDLIKGITMASANDVVVSKKQSLQWFTNKWFYDILQV